MSKARDIADSAATINVLDGVTATATELNYVDGVTSAIQTQIDGKQAADAQLTDIAGLTPTDGNIIIGDGTNFVTESGATARTSLGVAIGTDVQAYDSNLTSFVGTFTLPTTDGTADQVLTTNGSGTLSFADAGGGGFTSATTITGSTTWSIPSGVTLVKIYVTGGGGGSGLSYGCGGSAGGTAIKYLDVSSGGSITITIGSGGSSGSTGTAGGSSTAVYGATTITGGGGPGGNAVYISGGSASGGDINITGGASPAVSGTVGNHGAASFWGGGGHSTSGSFGAGGGAYNQFGSPTNGNGRAGVVVIEY